MKEKLVIISDESFSYFAENACEVAQHIRIDDKTGTVAKGALFNQENVPSESLFYTVIHAQNGKGDAGKNKTSDQALEAFRQKIEANPSLQIGANETTGLGWCTVALKEVK